MYEISNSLIADKNTSHRLSTSLQFVWRDVFKSERQIILGTHQEWRDLTAYTACPRAVNFIKLGESEDSPKVNICKVPKNVEPALWADTVSEIFCHSYGIKAPKELVKDIIVGLYRNTGVFTDVSRSSLVTMFTVYKEIATKEYSSKGYNEIFSKMRSFEMTGFGEARTLYSTSGASVDELLPKADDKGLNILLGHNLSVKCMSFIYGCVIAGIYLSEKYNTNIKRGRAFGVDFAVDQPTEQNNLDKSSPISIMVENAEEVFFDCDIFKEVYEVGSAYGISLKVLCNNQEDLPQYIVPNTRNLFDHNLHKMIDKMFDHNLHKRIDRI